MVYSAAESRPSAPPGITRTRKKYSLAWDSVISEKLTISMPNRIAEVIKNRGEPTKY